MAPIADFLHAFTVETPALGWLIAGVGCRQGCSHAELERFLFPGIHLDITAAHIGFLADFRQQVMHCLVKPGVALIPNGMSLRYGSRGP